MDEMPTDGFRHRPIWLVAVAVLLFAQAGFALTLFGTERRLAALQDNRPILSGRHPLHLYHGALGSECFLHCGSTTCYDPDFQAGYPKTPVFDGGCRPAELFLAAAGGGFRPDAYKLGLFACLLGIPLGFVLAGRGIGLPAGAAVLAGALGLFIGWSPPVRRLLEEGELDSLLAGLSALVFAAWMVRYARWFGTDAWLVLAGAAVAGWFANPVIWAGLIPVIVGYYIIYAPRRELAWNLGLVGIVAAGLAPNLWWLADWGKYWFLRHTSPWEDLSLPGWSAVLGMPGDYLALTGPPRSRVFAIAGLCGLAVLWRSGHRCGAGLLLASSLLILGVSRLAAAWLPTPDAAERLALFAASLVAGPAAFAAWKLLERGRCAGFGAAAAAAALAVIAWSDGPGRPIAHGLGLNTEPLALGFTSEQDEVIAAIKTHTTPDARILWDETTDHRPGWNWTALLPMLTDRSFLGGLDHEAGIEYSFCELRDGRLNSKALEEWSDEELSRYCWWYNVGWVACRSGAAVERWSRLPMARVVARLQEGSQPLTLLALDRPRSFVLKGTANWEEASSRRITLTDVVPDAEGFVVLSLHQQDGLRVLPSYIRIARGAEDPTCKDPIGHIRLRVPGPVPRVTLIWENP